MSNDISFPTESTSGKVELSKIRMLIFGNPKIGKTTLLSGFPNVLFLPTEKRYQHLKIMKIDIECWEDFQDAVDLILRKKNPYKMIAVDTIDMLYQFCMDYICEKLKIDHPQDLEFGKGYQAIYSEFDGWLTKLFVSNYGLLFTSHTRVAELFSRSGKLTKIVPTLPTTARRAILPKVSAIGYMEVRLIKGSDGKFVERRVLIFEPSEELECGDGEGRLPKKMILDPNPKLTYKLFEKAYSND